MSSEPCPGRGQPRLDPDRSPCWLGPRFPYLPLEAVSSLTEAQGEDLGLAALSAGPAPSPREAWHPSSGAGAKGAGCSQMQTSPRPSRLHPPEARQRASRPVPRGARGWRHRALAQVFGGLRFSDASWGGGLGTPAPDGDPRHMKHTLASDPTVNMLTHTRTLQTWARVHPRAQSPPGGHTRGECLPPPSAHRLAHLSSPCSPCHLSVSPLLLPDPTLTGPPGPTTLPGVGGGWPGRINSSVK